MYQRVYRICSYPPVDVRAELRPFVALVIDLALMFHSQLVTGHAAAAGTAIHGSLRHQCLRCCTYAATVRHERCCLTRPHAVTRYGTVRVRAIPARRHTRLLMYVRGHGTAQA